MEKHLGDKVNDQFVENVAEGPDAERVIHQLARRRRQASIFSTSFGFMNPTERGREDSIPTVKFEQATGYKTQRQHGRVQRALLRGPRGVRHHRRP